MDMLYSPEEIKQRLSDYAMVRHLSILSRLGKGTQGLVYETDNKSAVKGHAVLPGFKRELAAYQRLEECEVTEINGLSIPRLYDFDEKRLILEISIVKPPYLLDFGGAYLDRIPSHVTFDQIWSDQKTEEFGEDLPLLRDVMNKLAARTGIHLSDVNPANIRFTSEVTL